MTGYKQSIYLSQLFDLICVKEVRDYSEAMLIHITQDCSQHNVSGCICASMNALDFTHITSLYQSTITRLIDP